LKKSVLPQPLKVIRILFVLGIVGGITVFYYRIVSVIRVYSGGLKRRDPFCSRPG
jgi:hypothetical protein